MPEGRDLKYEYGMLIREAAMIHWALGVMLKAKGSGEYGRLIGKFDSDLYYDGF